MRLVAIRYARQLARSSSLSTLRSSHTAAVSTVRSQSSSSTPAAPCASWACTVCRRVVEVCEASSGMRTCCCLRPRRERWITAPTATRATAATDAMTTTFEASKLPTPAVDAAGLPAGSSMEQSRTPQVLSHLCASEHVGQKSVSHDSTPAAIRPQRVSPPSSVQPVSGSSSGSGAGAGLPPPHAQQASCALTVLPSASVPEYASSSQWSAPKTVTKLEQFWLANAHTESLRACAREQSQVVAEP
jgi:hypothetical protein